MPTPRLAMGLVGDQNSDEGESDRERGHHEGPTKRCEHLGS